MKELDLQEYKQVVLQVLLKVDKICRENNIRYMIFYGTLLGAVRHGGFIPWDDDIDIVMMRDDYNKLMRIIEADKENSGLNFISIENYPDTIYAYGKICDTSTELYEKNYRHVEALGAFVDVFPWDNIPNSSRLQNRYRKKCFNLMRLIIHSAEIAIPKGKTLSDLKKKLAHVIAKPFNTSKLVKKANKEFQRFNGKKTDYIGLVWEKPFPANAFDNLCEIEFEGHMFYAPDRYDELLTIKYGDYMTPPPESERVCTHGLVCYDKRVQPDCQRGNI